MNSFFPPLITTLIALLVYGLTLAPDLTWANFSIDGGELISTAVTLGIPHPPGYPTYVLLGNFFSHLPIGTVAFRFNLFSALCVALAAGLVTAVNQSLVAAASAVCPPKPLLPSIAAGLTFAFAPLIWGQALVSELYALNLLCLALFLWALLTARPSWLVGLFLGLSFTTHLTSLLMLPLAILLTEKHRLPPLTVGILIGLTPYLLLPLLAQSGSPIVWGDPTTLRGWWWLVTGQLYRPNLFAMPPETLFIRLREWAVLLPAQFLWIGFVFVGIGAVTAVNRKPLSVNRSPLTNNGLRITDYESPITDYRLPITILGTAVLYLIVAIGYNTADAIVFTLPALLLCAMLLGLGLQKVGGWSLALPILLLLLHFQTQNLSRSEMVRPSAEQLLTLAPPNALLLSSDEATTFTLWYFHHIENQRPDLIIADSNLFAFDWYRDRLRNQHPDLVVPEADDLAAFQTENEQLRPLCQVQIAPENETAVTLKCN